VAADLRNGMITPEAAHREYGDPEVSTTP